MKCSICGNEGRAGSASCSRCGTPFADAGVGLGLDDRTVMRPVLGMPREAGPAVSGPAEEPSRELYTPMVSGPEFESFLPGQPAVQPAEWAPQVPAVMRAPVPPPTQAMANFAQPPPPPPQRNVVVVANRKSVGVALLLTFLFGPLGMFYSTVAGALIMLVVSIGGYMVTGGLSVFVTLPVCMIWGGIAAKSANDKLMQQAATW